ncbi:unnamed protein product, partial [Laminaria digitata]
MVKNNWRASLVPAAAVIRAPTACIKVIAVNKVVVGFVPRPSGGALSLGPVSLALMHLWKTNYCESVCQGCFQRSKMVKYHRSLNHKLCWLGIGCRKFTRLCQHLPRNKYLWKLTEGHHQEWRLRIDYT